MSKEKRINKIVHRGEYQGVKFWIIKNGYRTDEYEYSWYCAYVEPPKDKLKKLRVEDLEVHGGITWNGYLETIGKTRVWGWDYNHYYDMDITDGVMKNKFQSKHEHEVIEIIADECINFIGRYLV